MILYRKFKDRIERNSFAGTGGWIIVGAKGYVGPPPSQIIGGAWPPSSYAYEFFLFLTETICCDHSFGPSQQDSSNEGSQHNYVFMQN